MKRNTQLPEIIKTYIKGFLGAGVIVAVLSVLALILHITEK